jgi:hypothetical protein
MAKGFKCDCCKELREGVPDSSLGIGKKVIYRTDTPASPANFIQTNLDFCKECKDRLESKLWALFEFVDARK